MSIVTRTGDKGETGLFGGQRVSKNDLRIETIGTVDELNAFLSLPTDEDDLFLSIIEQIGRIQNTLFTVGADLATPSENNNAVAPRIEERHIMNIEEWIDRMEETPLPPYFILPGGSRASALLHTARAICRRAERHAVSLSQQAEIGGHILKYLNRLSDFLFLAALEANRGAKLENIRVSYQ